MDIPQLLFYFLIIIPSAILHEYAHGAVADWLGDPTARYAGRLSLDPRKHVDLWGTILLPLILSIGSGGRFFFAYAKPVPYNPYNLRNQRWGPVAVAFAGPMTNFLLAFAFAILIRYLPTNTLTIFFAIIAYSNITLGVFNLVPIPPLDGSKLLFALLPNQAASLHRVLDQYGIILLLVFIFFFSSILIPIIEVIFRFMTGGVWLF